MTTSPLQRNGFASWLRSNLALIIALVTAISAIAAVLSSYNVLQARVETAEKIILQNRLSCEAHFGEVMRHHLNATVHVDPQRDLQLRQEILDRLERIERKLDILPIRGQR